MNSEQDNHLSDEQEYQSHPSEDMGQGIHQPVATGADAGETEPHEPEDAHLEIDAPTSTTSLAHAGGGGDTLPENSNLSSSEEVIWVEENSNEGGVSVRLQKVLVALLESPFISYVAILWSMYNVIEKEQREKFFRNTYGKFPFIPNLVYFWEARYPKFIGKDITPSTRLFVSEKIKHADSKDTMSQVGKFGKSWHSIKKLLVRIIKIGAVVLVFVEPLFSLVLSLVFVAVMLIKIISKQGYLKYFKSVGKSFSFFIRKLIWPPIVTSIWFFWGVFTLHGIFYISGKNLWDNAVQLWSASFGKLVKGAYKEAKCRKFKVNLRETLKAPIVWAILLFLLLVAVVSTLYVTIFTIQVVLYFLILFFPITLIFVVGQLISGEKTLVESVTDKAVEYYEWVGELWLFGISRIAQLFDWIVGFAFYGATMILIIGTVVPLLLLLLRLIIFPIFAILLALLGFYWISFQLYIIGVPVYIMFASTATFCLGLYIVRKLRQFIRGRKFKFAELNRLDIELVNETDLAKQYRLELCKNGVALSDNEIIEAEEKYGIYFDESETRQWMTKRPIGIVVAIILMLSVAASGFGASKINFGNFVASSSPVLDFVDNSQDKVLGISRRITSYSWNYAIKSYECIRAIDYFCLFSFDTEYRPGRRVDTDVTPDIIIPTTVPPTTTTEPFRLVDDESDCIQGEEFFFGGGCIPCDANPSQPACQVDASARDLECSIAEFEFGGGCVPCSANPQACAPPGLECAADEFIFGGGCVPCEVAPDSCGDGQNVPVSEGVSYTGVLGGGQTRDPPRFAFWTASEGRGHLSFRSSITNST